MSFKIIIGGLLAIGLLVAGYFLWQPYPPADVSTDEPDVVMEGEDIKSFEDCAAAGYPVMESHPRQCRTPGGLLFAEEIEVPIEYDNASEDMIRVESPHPGAVVGKEFRVVGEARGNWFFEASFPIEIIGASGEVIGGTYATAQGEWMTTEFVPFISEIIDLPSAYTGPATLILRKDNPSGLPENDASVSIPIVVEY